MNDYIYFYLPGLAEYFEINVILAKRIEDFPDHYYDNVRIGAIYGTVPGAMWNGGRYSDGYITDDGLKMLLSFHHCSKIPLRWTWTNPMLTEEDLSNEYCNNVTRSAENGINEVLVTNDMMENYIREKYPKYPIISSTTKRITGLDALNEELEKDYKLVVVDYDFNNKWDLLDKIEHKEKCELLVNPLCDSGCPNRKKHYEIIGKRQKGEFTIDKKDEAILGCQAQFRLMHDILELPTVITVEDLYEKYIPAGFRHFKIEGRRVCPTKPIEWILYYMVKPEYQREERSWLQMAMETTVQHPNIPIYYPELNS